jgi:hypothetical protein
VKRASYFPLTPLSSLGHVLFFPDRSVRNGLCVAIRRFPRRSKQVNSTINTNSLWSPLVVDHQISRLVCVYNYMIYLMLIGYPHMWKSLCVTFFLVFRCFPELQLSMSSHQDLVQAQCRLFCGALPSLEFERIRMPRPSPVYGDFETNYC